MTQFDHNRHTGLQEQEQEVKSHAVKQNVITGSQIVNYEKYLETNGTAGLIDKTGNIFLTKQLQYLETKTDIHLTLAPWYY
jgi:hypothetical protein